MAIWKFGCNWSGNPNDFYEFIRDESIVIGYQPHVPYQMDDLVLVTKGFTVLAIVQVDQNPRPITQSSYRPITEEYGIEWELTTIFAEAEWYELPPNLQFRYRCQRGAAHVGKQEILDATNELWSNRK